MQARESCGSLARLHSNAESQSLTCEFYRFPVSGVRGLLRLSQCVGGTATGSKDFEDFIGQEKASEFQSLFGAWIKSIYRTLSLEVFLRMAIIDLFHIAPDVQALFDIEQAMNDLAADSQNNTEGQDVSSHPPNTPSPVSSEPPQLVTIPAEQDLLTNGGKTITWSQSDMFVPPGQPPNRITATQAPPPFPSTPVHPAPVQPPPLIMATKPGFNGAILNTPNPPPSAWGTEGISLDNYPLNNYSLEDYSNFSLDNYPFDGYPTFRSQLATVDTSLMVAPVPPLVTTDPSFSIEPFPQPATINPSLLAVPVPQPATIDPAFSIASLPRTARMRTGGKAPRPGLSKRPIPGEDHVSLLNLPEGAHESEWMKQKGTLAYFRSAFKMGNLSTLISNWYVLEESLGFVEKVSLHSHRLLGKKILTFGRRKGKGLCTRPARKRFPISSDTVMNMSETIKSKPIPLVREF